jgi:hypothetical protein
MSDIFRSDNYLFGEYRFLKADSNPCPVCGHPTGNCTPDSVDNLDVAFAESKTHNVDSTQFVLVDEDVYIDKPVSPYATAKVLAAKKGQYISLDKARELGIN